MSLLLRNLIIYNLRNKTINLNKSKLVNLLNINTNTVRSISQKNFVLSPIAQCPNILARAGFIQLVRYKYNQKKGVSSQDDEDSDADDDVTAKDPNLIRVHVNSLRADLILKAGLGLARNKVEAIFYESKIRVNGEKIFKKSLKLNVGDEIDIIKGLSVTNPEHLIVARVEIVAAVPKDENILVKLKRNKSLIIENYPSENVWNPNDNPANS